jgi:hypothetical protein
MGVHKAGKKTMSDNIQIIEEHLHGSSNVYPTLAAGVTVTSSAVADTLGNYAEIVPASTITSDFDIHFINIEAVSAAATYELVLYDTTTEIGRIRFTAVGTPNNITFPTRPLITPVVAKNKQIQAKLASDNAVADTATISIEYHTY